MDAKCDAVDNTDLDIMCAVSWLACLTQHSFCFRHLTVLNVSGLSLRSTSSLTVSRNWAYSLISCWSCFTRHRHCAQVLVFVCETLWNMFSLFYVRHREACSYCFRHLPQRQGADWTLPKHGEIPRQTQQRWSVKCVCACLHACVCACICVGVMACMYIFR